MSASDNGDDDDDDGGGNDDATVSQVNRRNACNCKTSRPTAMLYLLLTANMQLIQADGLLFVRKSYRSDEDGPFLLQRDSSTPSYYRSTTRRRRFADPPSSASFHVACSPVLHCMLPRSTLAWHYLFAR